MTFWVAGALVGSAVISSNAASKAANTQTAAAVQSGAISKDIADRQLALQKEQFDTSTAVQKQQFADSMALQKQQYAEQVARAQPWLTSGKNALARIDAGEFAQPEKFSFTADQFQADPGYAFRLSEGLKSLERSAAARGGLLSGGTGKALQRFGQEMGSQEYTNAYNRALTGYNADVARSDTGYNRLAGMAGVGQATSGQLNQVGQNYANSATAAGQNYAGNLTATGQNYANASNAALGNYGTNATNALLGAANARASGYIGQANALNSAIGMGTNYYQNQQLLKLLS
jgi:hypothetical protein